MGCPADAYHSLELIGAYLQQKADLKTIADIKAEVKQITSRLIDNLTKEIQDNSRSLRVCERKYNETIILSFDFMTRKEEMDRFHNEGAYSFLTSRE